MNGKAYRGLAEDAELTEVVELIERLVETGATLDAIVLEHLATGGKRLRARLALAVARALGAPLSAAAGWAAACELLHNATLVHDDLQDGDAVRRGAPTVWARHGAAQAINAGDLLFVLPSLAIDEVPGTATLRFALVRLLASRAAAVIRGQCAEQLLISSGRLDWDSYAEVVRGKTSALFTLPVVGAALVAGVSAQDAARYAAPFDNLGLLFQIQDDVLDLYGDKLRGSAGSDLYEGKVSCLVVEHVALHPEEQERLLALLKAPRESSEAAEVAYFIERFRNGGALARTVARLGALEASISEAVLREVPALSAVVRDLLDRVMQPIAHVVP